MPVERALIRQRGACKASLTKLSNQLRGFDPANGNLGVLRSGLLTIERVVSKFEDLQQKIYDQLDDNDEREIAAQEQEAEKFEDTWRSIQTANYCAIETREDEAKTMANQTVGPPPDGEASALPQHIQYVIRDVHRPPEVQIPTFDGTDNAWQNEWELFRDLFNENVHNDKILTKAQKFQRLKGFLRGEAQAMIATLTPSDANYDVAYKTIMDAYNSEERQIGHHLKLLFALQPIKKSSTSELRTLLVKFKQHVTALRQLDGTFEHSDTILRFMLSSRLDNDSLRAWESKLLTLAKPVRFDAMVDALLERVKVLQAVEFARPDEGKRSEQSLSSRDKRVPSKTSANAAVAETGAEPANAEAARCKFCDATSHIGLWQCKKLWRLPPAQVLRKVEELDACSNCMSHKHTLESCPSKSTCRVCNQRHFTQLHDVFANKPTSSNTDTSLMAAVAPESEGDSTVTFQTSTASATPKSERPLIRGLIATVVIDVKCANGQWIAARGFLDPGSNCSYISEQLRQLVKAKKHEANIHIDGFGGSSKADAVVDVTIRSRNGSYQRSLSCFLLRHVMPALPPELVSIDMSRLENLHSLADPQFYRPGRIDLLLGADITHEVYLHSDVRQSLTDRLWLQETVFGQVVLGTEVATSTTTQSAVVVTGGAKTTDCGLNLTLKRFWTVEERVSSASPLTPEEERCERMFRTTHTRDASGRYVVRLPFETPQDALGTSREGAYRQFLALERRLARSEEIKAGYDAFMAEYLALGHMERCPHDEEEQVASHYFLPHHPVLRPDNLTTKLRVVFNGSAASSSNLSLNELLGNGPTIQHNVFQILIQFREHQVAFILDLTKMYRQILVCPEQRHLQSILWRDESDKPIEAFHLSTVTYGTKSAAYLATRSLKQLVLDEGEKYPLAARILDEDCYVDDVATSQPSYDIAVESARQLKLLLGAGQFTAHKWATNSRHLLPSIGEEAQGSAERKVLGIIWNVEEDTFRVQVPKVATKPIYTKRDIAAGVPEIYDPLGLLGPVTLRGKAMLQKTWLMPGVVWDTPLDDESCHVWEKYRSEMAQLDDLRVDRCFRPNGTQTLELHGFCDGSEVGYGACLYMRAIDAGGHSSSRLLCSKSRVAPVLKLTMPRIELCGALLLAELVADVTPLIKGKLDDIFLYTDSTIVLAWIHNSPAKMKLFVANRVARILQLTDRDKWRHVSTSENPADPLSRGSDPAAIKENLLWWHGPEFLVTGDDSHLSFPVALPEKLPEMKEKRITLAIATAKNRESGGRIPLEERFSSLPKTLRVAAYAARYCRLLLARVRMREARTLLQVLKTRQLAEATARIAAPTTDEIDVGERLIIGLVQRKTFTEELKQLRGDRLVSPKSPIAPLAPFLDENGLLRVGGRLHNAGLPIDRCHQLLLPKRHLFSTLLARHHHEKNCHAGPQLLLNTLQQRYWVIHGRVLCRSIVHECVVCRRARPKPYSQLMGTLPADRVTASQRPFVAVGVDYCGPFKVTSRIRGRAPTKVWLAIFVCMATHAVHIDIIDDCTTEEFLAAFRRFCFRRGRPTKVRSDNSTTFVGAVNQLQELLDLFRQTDFTRALAEECAKEGQIEWEFIPALSPHMGGMWESAVGSFKEHFKRIAMADSYTLLELLTLVANVEACMNSRPISPISTDPNDLRPLTPGHFIIGAPLNSFPEPDLTGVRSALLSRWQAIQAKSQLFWKRWSMECLNQVQQQAKWISPKGNAKIGDFVVLIDKDLPPLKWRTGRVSEIHPGADGLVRAVTVRTAEGEYTRAVHKVCPII